MGLIIGVDIGGTFTDGVVINDVGDIWYSKVPTTPSDRFEGILNLLNALSVETGMSLEAMLSSTDKFAHGTTATVNAFLQRTGSKVGLLVTKGFKNTLDIMKAGRGKGLPEIERLNFARVQMPEPLVPNWLIEEIEERVDYAGRVVVPMRDEQVRTAISRLLDAGVESLAVCFLWSFKNTAHEARVAEIAAEMGLKVQLTTSSELLPVQGEYERMITTVINCYLSPILSRYVFTLQDRLQRYGLANPVLIMQSMGGLIPGIEAPSKAVTTLISGLAGGLIGSQFLAQHLGYENVITTDMGGTSFEVGMIYDGHPISSNTPLAPSFGPFISRYQLSIPQIDITAIGAGAGSIAWIDDGFLKVGPLSAAAEPGPACYGRGGERPTVTDACLVMGYLSPDNFLGGRLKLEPELSRRAIRDTIGVPLGLDVVEAAKGIHEVVNNQMADLTRKVTIEKGYDPRSFVLFAYGGAGPMNCAFYGGGLGVKEMLIPGKGLATAHSAMGVAISDYKQVFAVTDIMRAPADVDRANRHFSDLDAKATRTLESWGVAREQIDLVRSVDMQYGKQVHEVNVPAPNGELTREGLDGLCDSFERRYESLFGADTGYREAGIEYVNFRVEGVGRIRKPSLRRYESSGENARRAVRTSRQVFFRSADDYMMTEVYTGEKLLTGNRLVGPAVIEFFGTTVVVPPDFEARVDPYRSIVLRKFGRPGR
jgi:N-methylhydantoinase A